MKRVREIVRQSRTGGAPRRYFVTNSFDLVLAVLGVIIGAHSTGMADPRVIVAAGIGASVGNIVSGFAGVFSTERAEGRRRLLKLEKALLRRLDTAHHGKSEKVGSLWAAFIGGVLPGVVSMAPLVPVIFALLGFISAGTAVIYSFAAAMVMLFLLGVILARVSKENIILSGAKMVLIGAVTALIAFLVGSHR